MERIREVVDKIMIKYPSIWTYKECLITQIDLYYNKILELESVWLQRFSNDTHTKRLRCESLQEIQQAHSKGYNHRKIGINEVIWDIDCHVPTLAHQIWQIISTNLQNDNVSHSVWDTSRSFHIHSLFEGFEKLCKDDRKALKKIIIKYYAKDNSRWCDKNMCNENVNIRDFNGLHELTGKPKKLIYEFKGKTLVNPIKPEILNDFKQKVSLYPQAPKSLTLGLNGALEPKLAEALNRFLNFTQNIPFPKSGMQKNTIYFKNIAIACHLLGIEENQAKQIFRNVSMQCKPHKPEAMMTWLKWCKSQKKQLKVNWREVKMFYDNNIPR